jgi:hypothetical protein
MGAHRGWSRVISATILALGILVVIGLNWKRQERETARAARALRVGDDSTSVLAALGAPVVRCQPGGLDHLRNAMPPGTPRPTAEETLQQLRRGTSARWVWGKRATCAPRAGHTEVGFTRDGRMLWAVAEHGAGPATLP